MTQQISPLQTDRREFLKKSLATSIGISLIGISGEGCLKKDQTEALDERETTPNEDLMREHGLLDRVLMVYESNLKKEFKPKVVLSAARIIQDFIENYHEKLEEEFLFPVLEKISTTTGLVATLKNQHEVGRKITSSILHKPINPSPQEKAAQEQEISAFMSMYRAHAAREDTVLFPTFKAAISVNRYKELGEIFEEREHKLFGKDGFAMALAQVEALEKEMGIFDLAIFTPRLP